MDIPNDEVTQADIKPRADLFGADLSGANLYGVNLSGADLAKADLSGANLASADLSGADLSVADLSDALLAEADLSKADLTSADLSGAQLRVADLSEANLLTATISDVTVNQRTRLSGLPVQPVRQSEWDDLAQAYHDFKVEFQDHGLADNARQAYLLERKARTKEAWAHDDWAKVGSSLLSQWLTGYGVRVSYVLCWTVVILALTTLWYHLVGVAENSVYYSVVTFTTSPPHPPRVSGVATWAIVLFETYVGTTLIVLLGYVLGNRERF